MNSQVEADVKHLYEKTGRAAISKTARLVGRRDVAEEIVQETFCKLWNSQLEFSDEKAAYMWVYKSCHNAGIDYLRLSGTKREYGVESDLLSQLSGVVDQDVVSDRQELDALIGTLDPRESRILAYRVLDGLTQDEIANLEECSRKTVVRKCKVIDEKIAQFRKGRV